MPTIGKGRNGFRRALTPTAPYGCQRPLISNVYYPTFNRDDVDLVTVPISHVTAAGVVTADGVEHLLDTLILATGFRTTAYLAAVDVTGRGGRHITDHWADGAHAYLGITTAGFPNLFMLYGPNTNQGANSIIYILEAGARLVASAVARLARSGGFVDVRPDVERRFNDRIAEQLEQTIWTRCDSYYRSPSGRIVTQWPHSELDYAKATWRLRPGDWVHSGSADSAK